MKIVINGYAVEGTVEEILAITSNKVMKKSIVEAEETQIRAQPSGKFPRRSRLHRFYPEILKKCEEGDSLASAFCSVTGYFPAGNQRKAILRYAERMGITILRKKKPAEINKGNRIIKISDETRQKHSDRMRWIRSRIGSLCGGRHPSTYGLDYERAFRQASEEYRLHGRKERIAVESGFPVVISQPNLNMLLPPMIERIIQSKGKLTFFAEGQSVFYFDFAQWRDFCVNFMHKSLEISKYFRVPNNFFLHNSGAEVWIEYK